MPEVRRYLSLALAPGGSALAAGYWFAGRDGEPKFGLALSGRGGSNFRLLTLDEVDELRAACSRFLADVDTRRAAMGGACTGRGDCRCHKCSPLSEL